MDLHRETAAVHAAVTQEPGQRLRAHRRRGWLAAAGGALLAALALQFAAPAGPRYDGRPLRHWLLLAASENHQDRLRAEAILRQVGPEAVPELIRALEARKSKFQRIWRLVRVNVLGLEPDDDLSRRVTSVAIERLAGLGPAASNAAPALLLLGTYSSHLSAASRALQAIGPAGAPHLSAAVSSPDPNLSYFASYALSSEAFLPAADQFLPALTAALHSPEFKTQIGAIRALAVLARTRPEMAAALAAQLPAAAENVAVEVLVALRAFGPAGANCADPIAPLLESQSVALRYHAARALRAVRPPAREVVPVLIRFLREPDVQWEAAQTLGEMGADAAEAIPALLTLLETAPTHRPSRTPNFAALALRQMGPAAVPGLVKLLDHTSSDVRVNATVALAGLGDAAAPAVPGLIRMLGAEDPEEQMAAADALRALGPVARDAVPELTRLANLETTQDVIVGHVRSAARLALERIRVSPPRD
jgi:HEAT repeat protein